MVMVIEIRFLNLGHPYLALKISIIFNTLFNQSIIYEHIILIVKTFVDYMSFSEWLLQGYLSL